MIIEMGSENWIENSLSRLVGMLNGPQALPEPKLEMMPLISFGSQGLRIRSTGLGSVRYDWKDFLALGIFFSIEGPTLTK